MAQSMPSIRCAGAVLAVAVPLTALAACQGEPEGKAPQARPVRTVTVEKSEAAAPLVLTGRVELRIRRPSAFAFPAG